MKRGKIVAIMWVPSTEEFYGRYENGQRVLLGGFGTKRLTNSQKLRAIRSAGGFIPKSSRR